MTWEPWRRDIVLRLSDDLGHEAASRSWDSQSMIRMWMANQTMYMWSSLRLQACAFEGVVPGFPTSLLLAFGDIVDPEGAWTNGGG